MVKEMTAKVQKIEISYKTIVFTLLFLIALWFLYQIRDILLLLFISLILVGALNPIVNRLEKCHFPRWLAIILIYLLLLGIFIIGIAGLIPTLIDQTSRLAQIVINWLDEVSYLGFSSGDLKNQIQELSGLPAQIFKLAVSIFSNILSLFAILLVTFYLILEHKNLDRYLFFLFGPEGKKKSKKLINRLERKLGGWVRAELLLMTIIGLLSYLGFRLLNLRFALSLALLAGVLEIVPNIGPILAAVPAVLIGFLGSPLTALLVTAWAFLIQQLENNLIVPRVMQKSAGVNPLITILTLAIGFKLAGVMGAILAIPVYLAIETLAIDFASSFKKPRNE